jgi:hypothetical protein
MVCGVSTQASAGEERRLGLASITHTPSMLLI